MNSQSRAWLLLTTILAAGMPATARSAQYCPADVNNSGVIDSGPGYPFGVEVRGTCAITNSGTIFVIEPGNNAAIPVVNTGNLTSLTNTGTIEGLRSGTPPINGNYAIETDNLGVIGQINNSGTIKSTAEAIYNQGTTNSIINNTTGLIQSNYITIGNYSFNPSYTARIMSLTNLGNISIADLVFPLKSGPP